MSPSGFLLALVLATPVPAAEPFETGLSGVFGDFDSCFLLLDAATGERRSHGSDCAERSTPASTFKVPHAVLALETGVVPGPSHVIEWDGRPRGIRSWNRDHDLASAVEHSVLWYFQETARRIGSERMAAGLVALDYGNHDSTSGLTSAWLGGSLEVSPAEQVDFLDRLRRGSLLVSERAQALVRELIIVERRGDAVLRGKSGTHLGPDVGWYVGWVERDGRAWVYATRIRGEGARGFSKAKGMSIDALQRLGIWERSQPAR
jgi:beta-lactamase class D